MLLQELVLLRELVPLQDLGQDLVLCPDLLQGLLLLRDLGRDLVLLRVLVLLCGLVLL